MTNLMKDAIELIRVMENETVAHHPALALEIFMLDICRTGTEIFGDESCAAAGW